MRNYFLDYYNRMVNLIKRLTTPAARAVNTVRKVGRRGVNTFGNMWNSAGYGASGAIGNVGEGANSIVDGVLKPRKYGRRRGRMTRMTRKMKKNMKKSRKQRK